MSFIGLAGAHRTGKTTMAKRFAEDHGCEYVTISMTQIMADMGLEPADIQDVQTRLKVQRKAVQACDRMFVGRKTAFIADRTPIDVAAYTIADAVQGFYGPEYSDEAVKIVDDCLDITNMAFSGILHVHPSPHIKYVMEPGKPKPDNMYQLHIDAVIGGLLGRHTVKPPVWFISGEVHDQNQRDEVMGEFYGSLIDDDISTSQVIELH